jgi:hypothetical protein
VDPEQKQSDCEFVDPDQKQNDCVDVAVVHRFVMSPYKANSMYIYLPRERSDIP